MSSDDLGDYTGVEALEKHSGNIMSPGDSFKFHLSYID